MLCGALTKQTNETWKIYTRHCGSAFVHRISFCTWHRFEGRTHKNEVQQKIREDSGRSSARCQFTGVHTRTVGAGTVQPGQRYPWKSNIVTTIFWIGEKPSGNNPVPNRTSSWDHEWTKNYGGVDDPNPARRSNYMPVNFTPKQNPFYCALPYNDKAREGHRPEASRVVPWFNEAYQGPAVSTCKGHWIAIRKGNRVAYAQWEDAGPFRTDHWQYVSETNGRSLISTKALASTFRLPCAITSA